MDSCRLYTCLCPEGHGSHGCISCREYVAEEGGGYDAFNTITNVEHDVDHSLQSGAGCACISSVYTECAADIFDSTSPDGSADVFPFWSIWLRYERGFIIWYSTQLHHAHTTNTTVVGYRTADAYSTQPNLPTKDAPSQHSTST